MTRSDPDLILELRPTALRCLAGCAFLGLTALVLAFAAMRLPGEAALFRLGAAVLAALVALQAVQLWQASRGGIALRRDGLYCQASGRRLAGLEEIDRVESGLALFKPASGFLVRLKAPKPFARQAGIWWIRGNRLGLGGVTPKARGKVMAAALTELLNEQARETRPAA